MIINDAVITNVTPEELPKELNLKLSHLTTEQDAIGKIKITKSLSEFGKYVLVNFISKILMS